jgi:hypothetical protein
MEEEQNDSILFPLKYFARSPPPPPLIVLQKAFDMVFFQKVFSGVFELPLLRHAQKRHKKNHKKKKGT